MSAVSIVSYNLHPRFNGAVTFSLRKFPLLDPFHTPWPGFNGAVTFSLRKLISAYLLLSLIFALQWGRNFFVTEICEMAS